MRISIPTTRYHKIANAISLFCVLGIFVYLFLNWPQIPQQIPMHYNFTGAIDRWDSKQSLLLFPIISLLTYIAITIVERFPQAWNTGITVTEENRAFVYRTLKDLLLTTKLTISLIFTSLTFSIATASPLPIWWTPIALTLILGPTLFHIIRLYKTK